MSIIYKYDPILNLIRTTVSGVLTTTEIIQHATKVSNDSEIKDSFTEIVDMGKISDLVVCFSETSELSDSFSQWRTHGHTISIFYTPNELSEKITNFMLPLVRNSGISIHAFKTKKQISDIMDVIEPRQ